MTARGEQSGSRVDGTSNGTRILSERARRWPEPFLCLIGALAIWEIASRSGLVYEHAVPPPTRVASALTDDVQQHYLWQSVWLTLKQWAIGMAIVVAIAIPIGTVLGLSKAASRLVTTTLEFIRAIPSIAALPILILLYGIGFKLVVVLIILGAVWPLLIQTMYGVRDVDPIARDTARVYGLGRTRIFKLVVVPSAAPYVATGLRLAGVTAMILAIAATLIVGGGGLGAAIAGAQQSNRIPQMYDRIFVAALLGAVITLILQAFEGRLLRWHPSLRDVA